MPRLGAQKIGPNELEQRLERPSRPVCSERGSYLMDRMPLNIYDAGKNGDAAGAGLRPNLWVAVHTLRGRSKSPSQHNCQT